MAKDTNLTALAASGFGVGDVIRVVDVSAGSGKKCLAENLIEGLARSTSAAGSGLLMYDGTTATVTATTLALTGKQAITSSNAAAFAVGRQGATTPAFSVDASVSTNVTGWKVTGRAAAARADLTITSSGTNEGGDIDAKGSGTLRLNATATGAVLIGTQLQMPSAGIIQDANGNELIKFPSTVASAVNELTITNAATGNPVLLASTGGDTNIGLKLDGKGSGTITLNATGTGNVILGVATLQFPSAGIVADANGNELIKFPSTVASAVNELTVTNAATGNPTAVSATGGDTNISLRVTPKGTGVLQVAGPITRNVTQTAKTNSATLTIAEVLTGCIDSDVTTSGQTYTLPTAANLVAGIANCRVGDSFYLIVNNKDATDSVALAAGSGGTADGTLSVPANQIKQFVIIVTNVTGSSEAYFLYGLD